MINRKTQIIQRVLLILIPLLLIVLFIIIRNTIILPKTEYFKIDKYYSGSLINKSSYNDYTFKYITTENLVSRLHNDYKNKLINDSKEAYKIINKKGENKLFVNYDEFEKYINKNKEKFIYSNIKKYSSEGNTIKIIDQYNYKYTFEYNNPVDYKVTIEID